MIHRRLRYIQRQKIKHQIIFSLILSFLAWVALVIFLLLTNRQEAVLYSPLGVVKAQEKELTIEDKIRAAFPEDQELAVKVAFCESSHIPTKTNKKSSAVGLFQILKGTWNHYDCTGDKFNADDNIRCARKIYDSKGWDSTASWKASKNCWSK